MTCGGCGNLEAVHCHGRFIDTEQGERQWLELCEKCGDLGMVFIPDVFFDGKPEENLADGPDGKPRVFLSKGQKARYLQEHGICEAGDLVHGAPLSSLNRETIKDPLSRERIREARATVEKMGRDYRRQEVLKIIKQAEQFEKGRK